jgi:copper chaperone
MAEMVTARFATTGMHCGSCAMLIQMTLEDLDGVASAKADTATGVTEVVYDPDITAPAAIVGEIVKAGYGAEAMD